MKPAPRHKRYGFIVHPLDRPRQLLQRVWTLGRSPAVVRRFPALRLLDGTLLEGRIEGIDATPAELLADQERSVAALVAAARRLQDWGADCVGLGAVAAVVGGRGRGVAEALGELPVTTGHGLTTWTALRTVPLATRWAGLPDDTPATVLGAPGPVALGLAGCLALSGRPVRLVLDPLPPPVARYLARFPTITALARGPALAEALLLIGASSTGDSVREEELRPGALLVDVAQPRDLVRPLRRNDVRLVDGELLCLPPGNRLDPLTRTYNRIVGQGSRHLLACFAEPMVLAAAGPQQAAELLQPARFPDPERILRLGALAEQAGFGVDQLFRRGLPL